MYSLKKKQKIALLLIIFFLVIAVSISYYLTSYHYKSQGVEEREQSFLCTIGKSFNCDIVNTSPYSEMFGIPIALYGLFFYLAFLVLVVFCLCNPAKAEIGLIIAHGFALFSIIYSMYLFYIVKFVIGVFCLYCLIIYGINITLFVLTKIAVDKRYKDFILSIRGCLKSNF